MKRLLLLLGVCLGFAISHAQITAPFTESFNTTAIPSGWTNTSSNTSANANWKFTGTPGNPLMTSGSYVPPVILDHTQNGGSIAWSDGSTPAVADCGLMTDSIDISSLTSLWLEFWYYSNNVTNPGDNNTLYVNFYDGTQWNDSIWGYSGDGSVWQYGAVDLSSYTTSGKILFEFVLDQTTSLTAFYNDVLLDDISVKNVPTCPLPLNLSVSNITSSGADISWNTVTAATNGYEVIYGAQGFNPATGGNTTTTTNNFITLSGLTGATDYDVYIIADCGTTNGISDTAGPIAFTTLCVPFTAPYSRNFDSDLVNQLPLCWGSYWNSTSVIVDVYQFATPHSTPNHLRLYSGASSTSDTVLAISPQFTDMTAGNKQVTFWTSSSTTTNVLYVGTTADQTGQSAFNPIDTIYYNSTNTPVEYIIPISTAVGYNGTDQYIAFKHGNNQTFSSIYIDDVLYEVAPPCPKVQSSQLTIAAGATSATAVVQGGGSFQIEWGPVGYAQGTGTFITGSSPMSLTGMTPSTCYDLYIRRDCSGAGNGFSSWEGPFSFCTTCLPQSMTVLETFDAWPPTCWDSIGGTAYWEQYIGSGGDNYAVADFWNNSTGVYLLTSAPIIIDVQAQIHFFWSHLFSTFYPDDAIMIRTQSLTTGVWDTILYLRAADGNFNDPAAGNTSPGNFIEETHQLPASYIGDTIKVEIRGISDFGPNAYLNNFAVEPTPSCLPTSVADINASTTSDSVYVFWTPGAGVKWNVEIGGVGFTPGMGLGVDSATVIDTTAGIGGLAPNSVYHLYLQDSCSDGSMSPWVGPIVIKTKCLPLMMPVYESLDIWPVSCWDSTGGTEDWVKYTGTGGDNYAVADFWSVPTGTYHLTSPPISITQDAQVRFFWSHLYATFYPDEQLLVRVQVAGSPIWDTILLLMGPMDFNDASASNTAPGNFIEEEILLDPAKYTGNDIIVEFVGVSDFGPNCYLNNIYIENAPACPKPSALTAAVGDTFAIFDWTASAAHTNYEVWFGPQGFYQGSSTVGGHKVYSPVDSLLIDTLRSATCYEYVVRAMCMPGDTTEWEGPFVFCTSCRPYSMPYYQSYDVWPPICWKIDLGTVDWEGYQAGTDGWAEADFWGNSSGNMVMNSPPIEVVQDAQVRYTWSHLYSTFYPDDELIVRVTVVGSGVWDTIQQRKAVNGNFDDPTAGNTNPGAGIEDVLLLDPLKYTGNQIVVQFWGNTDFGPNCYINDFYVEKIPTCFRPDSLAVSNITVSSADISWVGDTMNPPGVGYEVSYGIGLNDPNLGTKMVTTNPNLTLTSLSSSSAYCFYVREICVVGDTSSWEGPLCFLTPCTTIMAPWSEDFEFHTVGHWDGTDVCWTFASNNPSTSSSGGYSWEVRNTPQATSGTSTGPDRDNTLFPNQGGVFITADVSGSSTLGPDTTLLISPVINIANLSSPMLEYHIHRFGTILADLHVDIYNGTTWVRSVHSYTNQAGIQTSQAAAWTDTTIDLTSYAGTTNLQVRFRSVTNGCCAGDNAVDDVSIYDANPSGCPLPSALAATSVGCDTATLTWVSATGSSVLLYGPTGFVPPAGTFSGIVTSPYTLTGLMSGTTYDVYVADTCANDTSSIVGPFNFTTTGGVVSASFTSQPGIVTATDRNFFFDASASVGGVTYSWNFGDGTTGSGVNTSHLYTANGSYIVTLVVSSGCSSDTISDTVLVEGIGLYESVLRSSLIIFPNPTEEMVNISFETSEKSATITLTDMSGKEVMVEQTDDIAGYYTTTLDLSNLAEGFYMIRITDGVNTVVQRMIKR